MGALACLLGFLACSSSTVDQPDPYYGVVDPTAFDAKFLPATTGCPSGVSSCYPAQQGYAHGQPFYFYNFGAVATSKLQSSQSAPIPASVVTTTVYTFADGTCTSGVNPDPLTSSYPQNQGQFPIFSALPLASTSATVLPLVKVASVTGTGNETCNDLKTAASLSSDPANPGNYGAVASAPTAVAIWPVVDNSAPFATVKNVSLNASEGFGWYKGLQLQAVNGGTVPQDASGNLVAMDGVILDPPAPAGGAAQFAKVTDAKAIILPAKPGEPGYSPIVRLWDYTYAYTQPLGTYTDICHGNTQACAPNQVDIDKLKANAGSKVPFNTLFIVASPQ